ncbi:glycosyltransferase family 4 protein [Carnobacterium maltaromaticum]|uniref:glycosyltransferase family 4 protein n=1 Tax=Carnobacterium maltaromaticum TaxID=2751 RepID=UPI003B982EA5
MKILVVSQSFYPDNFKINKIVQKFVKEGHEVDVLTGLPDYETGKIPKEYLFFKNRKQYYNGTTVHRVPTVSRRSGPVFRSLNYLSFVFFGWFWALFNNNGYDVVYVYQVSPVTMGIPAIKAAQRNNAKLVIYCLDIWPECVKAMNIEEGTLAFRMIHRISKYVYSKADVIPVSSPYFIEYLEKENKIATTKTMYIPQHSDKVVMTGNHDVTNRLFSFLFTGNIGLVQDIEVIINAVAEIDMSINFKVDIVGDGSNLAVCRQLVLEKGLEEKIIFHGRCPASEIPDFYSKADICLLTLKNENRIGMTIPSKLQGYMAAGKPIIAAIDGDAKKIIDDAKCGLSVSSGDFKALAKIMEEVIKHPEKNREYGENAKSYFMDNFTEEKFIFQTLSVFSDVKVNG